MQKGTSKNTTNFNTPIGVTVKVILAAHQLLSITSSSTRETPRRRPKEQLILFTDILPYKADQIESKQDFPYSQKCHAESGKG